MKTERYQFLAIVAVFTFGFFSHDLFHGNENRDDVYYQDKPDSLQCTINLDCDNHYDLRIIQLREVSEVIEYLEELKYHDQPRFIRS